MKTWFTATCVLIVLAALLDNSTAGNDELIDEEIDVLKKLIRILFDEKAVFDKAFANVRNFEWQNTDWEINWKGAVAKCIMISDGKLGIDCSHFKNNIETGAEYGKIFLTIFPEEKKYETDTIVKTITNLNKKEVIELWTLVALIFGGEEGEMGITRYKAFLRIILGIQDLTDIPAYIPAHVSNSFEEPDCTDEEEEVFVNMSKIQSKKELAAFCRGCARFQQDVEEDTEDNIVTPSCSV